MERWNDNGIKLFLTFTSTEAKIFFFKVYDAKFKRRPFSFQDETLLAHIVHISQVWRWMNDFEEIFQRKVAFPLSPMALW